MLSINIYLGHFSKLAIPAEDIKDYAIMTEGFRVVKPELLLILKQGAFLDRKNSVKGEKDKIDIMSIILFSNIDFSLYFKILTKYKLENYFTELKNLINKFEEYDSVGLNPREFKIKKKKILGEMKKA